MAMIVHKSVIVVEKTPKTFDDGRSGYFCVAYERSGKMFSFWCPVELDTYVGDENDITQWEEGLSREFDFRMKEWQGKTKYTLVDKSA